MDKNTYLEIKDKFFSPHDLLEKYHKIRKGIKAEIAELKGGSSVYSQDYLNEKIKKAESSLREAAYDYQSKFRQSIEQLHEKLIAVEKLPITQEQAAQLNAYTNLIASGLIEHEEAKKINANFQGDQTALRLLKRAYEKVNSSDGGIDKMIYSGLGSLPKRISDIGYYVFHQGGSVNDLAKPLGELAAAYGVNDYNWHIDESAFDYKLRNAAGLAGLPVNDL